MRLNIFLIITLAAGLLSCAGGSSLSGGNSKKSPPKEEADKDSEAEQSQAVADDESAIPPESIAGAYLTCEGSVQDTSSNAVTFGCNAFDRNAVKLDLHNVDAKWDVVDDSGKPVPKSEVKDQVQFDRAWLIARKDAGGGLNGELTVPVADGKGGIAIVRKKSGDTIYKNSNSGSVEYQ